MTRSGCARQETFGVLHVLRQTRVLRLTEPRSERKLGRDAVRANLDLSDFVENLAGNHAGQKVEG